MPKRDWKKWPKRFLAEASTASGVVGIVGTIIGASAVVVSAPTVALAAGAAASIGLGWSAIRAVPKKNKTPEDLLGRRIYNFSELEDVYPPLRRIGLIGPTMVGKSTTVAHLQAEPVAGSRTDNPYAVIVRLPGSTNNYFALVDAAGHKYSQQFKVSDNSDDLIVFLDHSESDTDKNFCRKRANEEKRFLSQLSSHLDNQPARPKRILFLMNKRDLWQQGQSQVTAERWFSKILNDWPSHPATTISSASHSNLITGDQTVLVQTISRWA